MILIINICKEKLGYYEFVRPIESILENNKIKFFTKHYNKVNKNDLKKSDKIIIRRAFSEGRQHNSIWK